MFMPHERPFTGAPMPEAQNQRPVLSQSTLFNLDQLPVRTMPNGGKSWDVLRGTLITDETVAIHESLQPSGLPPNPKHKIAHSEFVFVSDGTLEFQYDGKSERLSAGSVIFVAPGTMHAARNVGDG